MRILESSQSKLNEPSSDELTSITEKITILQGKEIFVIETVCYEMIVLMTKERK